MKCNVEKERDKRIMEINTSRKMIMKNKSGAGSRSMASQHNVMRG
jgi:hypothetical protein